MTPSTRCRIVIVEDVELEAKLVSRTLKDHGWGEIVHVKDATQALASMADESPTILICDVELGSGPTGIEIIRRLRGRHNTPYVYAIVLTSRGTSNRVQEAFEAGADDFVTKPFQQPELVARIRAGERLIRMERTLAVKAAELEATLRAVSPEALSAAIQRANDKMYANAGAVEKLMAELPWEGMRDVLLKGLTSFVGTEFTTNPIGDRASAIVGEVFMAEATRQLELGVTVVCDGESAKHLAGLMLGDDNDIAGACELILEAANVLMGCLKTAYIEHGYSFTVGLPTQPLIQDARAAYDSHAHRQRFAFSTDNVTIEIWVRVSDKRNRTVKGAGLKEGMILVDDVRDERGMLLVRGGTRLTATTAQRLAGLVADIEVTIN